MAESIFLWQLGEDLLKHDWPFGLRMNNTEIKNVVRDEANNVTYEVVAERNLTDGEVFSAIRTAILRNGGRRPKQGETIVIQYGQRK